jgi:hypothetical protein
LTFQANFLFLCPLKQAVSQDDFYDHEQEEQIYDALWSMKGKMERIGAVEYKKLIPYLEEFYQGRSVSYVRRLIIDQGGRFTCQGLILQSTEKKKTRGLLLKEYQEEMRAFTEFLKQKFFSDQSLHP